MASSQQQQRQGQGGGGLGSSLRKLKATSRGRRTSRAGPPSNSAAASHELNDKYMETMEEAFRSMGHSKENIDIRDNRGSRGGGHVKKKQQQQRRPPFKGGQIAEPSPGESGPQWQLPLGRGWTAGPRDPKGTTTIDLSDRPSLCMDMRKDSVVIGSSDHALYEVNLSKGKRTRTLYSKAYGHAEWVNAVKYFPDGKVLSAGLDSKLLLWHASAVRATELKGHSHSVSAIDVSQDGGLACSCGYDKTIRFWSVAGLSGRETQCLRGHKAPIIEMAWRDAVLVSGSRDGTLISWDVAQGKPMKREAVAHQGHITALALAGDSANAVSGGCLVLSGGQDGCLRVADHRMRSETPVFQRYHHRSGAGAGAVGAIRTTSAGLVLTMGADKRICVSDPRMGFEAVRIIERHEDFIYSMEVLENLVLSGSGDGKLLVHNLRTGERLYDLEGHQNAVRSLGVSEEALVASGDDGNCVIYDMS